MADSLRIAYVVNTYPSVSHTFIRREIQALEAHGHTVLRFSMRVGTGLVDAADQGEAARTHVVLAQPKMRLLAVALRTLLAAPAGACRALGAMWAMHRRSPRGLVAHAAYLIEAAYLLPRLRAAQVQHVHAHFGSNGTAVARLIARLGGPGYSFTVHGPEEFDAPVALSLPEKIAEARFVVAISSFGRAQLCRWCASDAWGKLHIVRCAVDAAWLDAPPAPPTDAPRLLFVGRLSEQKGVHVLLEAFARLSNTGTAAELVLAGDGPLRASLAAQAEAAGIAPAVRFLGYQSGEQIRTHLAQARALVMASFAEGLPVVIMEALALGRPVVATYVAGIPELVRVGETGWLAPAGDTAALAEAMREVLQADAATRARMGAAGRSAVQARHHAPAESATLAAHIQAALRAEAP